MSFAIGDIVGDYRILEELGRGGMGQVFKVEHTITRRLEAMKVLKDGRPGAPEQAARSLREIQVQASLDHPNIAAVHNAFWAGEDLVLVMELIEGCSLRRLLENGPVPLETAIDYICQALAALSYAHERGVIHRDISPSNMMISHTGVFKLTDFGLSKGSADWRVSQAGAPIGSLYYMSPEQVRGTFPADARSDIYSLGAVLYELATGRKPFEGASAFSIMTDQVAKPPVPPIELEPSLPRALSDAILTALQKDPALRFGSADQFLQVLTEIQQTAMIQPGAPPLLSRSWMIGAAAALGVILLSAAVFLFSGGWPSPAVQAPAASTVHPPEMMQPANPIPAENPPLQVSPSVPAPPPLPLLPARIRAPKDQPPSPQVPPPPPVTASTAPPEAPPPDASTEASPENTVAAVPEQTDADAAASARPNPFRQAVGKMWRLLRHKSAPDDANRLRPNAVR